MLQLPDASRHSLRHTARFAIRSVGCAAVVALLAGSSGAFAEEADPMRAVPASIAALHADLKFSVATSARAQEIDPSMPAAMLQGQITRIAPVLESAARGLYAAQMQRIGKFDVYLAEDKEIEARSSSTGKIAINTGMASLQLTDDTVAFLLAREMGHVLGGHHEENSTASIITSIVMNLLIPGSSLIKSAISMATSEAASSSGVDRQIREADEIALQLLETAGFRRNNLALGVSTDLRSDKLGAGSWASRFRASATAFTQSDVVNPVAVVQAPVATPPAAAPITAASAPVIAIAEAPAQSTAARATPANAVEPARMPEEPFIRTRLSGVAGPLLLGGFAVPVRRID